MKSFIAQVLQELINSGHDISENIFILPSKRAGSFLLNELAQLSGKNIFAPEIYSIEEFTEQVANLQAIDNTTSLFEFYAVYKDITPENEQESFEFFTAWAQTLIHDFNEIDRYLLDQKSFFNYLADIQDINHWYLQEEKTDLIKNYLKFWNSLPRFYDALKKNLLQQKKAYQGLLYRQAAEKIGDYAQENMQKHVFLGFNALNSAEQEIIQYMLKNANAEVFWDIDKTFLQDSEHEASLFINQYLREWPFYKENKLKWPTQNYSGEKKIEITGVPGNIGQAKYVADILARSSEEELRKTAVVLGDEGLLLPVINSLPPNVKALNITMGFPLKNAPVTSLFDKLLTLHKSASKEFYHKDVVALLSHPSLHQALHPFSDAVIHKIRKENLVYLKASEIAEKFPEANRDLVTILFGNWNNDPLQAIENFDLIIQQIKKGLKKTNDTLGLEFLYHFHILFNKLENLCRSYPHIKTVNSLYTFYKEILASQNLDFEGKPFEGLQLMGMLESRALDFENVIITSVNEGVLPSGKSINSFIPYDLKKAYSLPTYKEKDAVYTYHFYRLLQRATNVQLLYNTETNGMNSGEKSRFLTQLEIERQPKHQIIKNLVTPQVTQTEKKLKEVQKTPEIIERLKELAGRGFSPSALTTYIRNPLDFYYQYILRVKEQDDVEETVAYNTLGTVVHDTLENFYKPMEGKTVSEENIQSFLGRVNDEISLQFKKTYTKAPLDRGKNLLVFEVAKRYITNFLKQELKSVKSGQSPQIIQIETDLKAPVRIEKFAFPVYIRGKVDRVEKRDGVTRIIDFKTGKVIQSQIEVVAWEDITKDYDKHSKSFQVLAYATMMSKMQKLQSPVEAGIISFKNMQSGFMKFSKKESEYQKNGKKSEINEDVLEAFETELGNLITEICDPEIPFTEKELKNTYGNY